MIDWQRIRTPAADGDVLVEPPFARWPALLKNAQPAIILADRPIAEVRADTRRHLGLPGDSTPIIASGHQPAYVHPGVWAKQVAIRHVAEKWGYGRLDLVVDNDAPHGNKLAMPVVGDDKLVTVRLLSLGDGRAGSAYESRPAVGTEQLDAVRAALPSARSWLGDDSLFDLYLDTLSRCDESADFVGQHLAGCQAVDAALGVELQRVRVSEAFGGAFLADLLLNADRFAASYNAALAVYRGQFAVRSPQRPLPDLGRDGDWVEACLWIYQPLMPRGRLWVRRRGDVLELRADRTPVGSLAIADLLKEADGAVRMLRPWVLRPRALTLTLWARLLVCDLFVHGIGGAKYDRITDEILRDYYHCPPPPYACVSATLRLPIDVPRVEPADLREAKRQLRDFPYNPDRYLQTVPEEAWARRKELIAASYRLHCVRGDRFERHRVFLAIRELNQQLAGSDPDAAARLARRVETTARQLAGFQVAAGREYFYALFPSQKLAALAERLLPGTPG